MNLGGKSHRERLIRTATKLKLSFRPDISEDALLRLIDAQPATDRQLLILDDALRPHKRSLPIGMTYGQARRALAAVMEALNENAITSLKLVEGAVREWDGKYYYVMRIGGSADRYRVTLCEVTLSRPRGAARAVMKQSSKGFKMHPVNLLYVSGTVDLATWQPNSHFKPRIDPDEPLF